LSEVAGGHADWLLGEREKAAAPKAKWNQPCSLLVILFAVDLLCNQWQRSRKPFRG
jgi:hypothetical protein